MNHPKLWLNEGLFWLHFFVIVGGVLMGLVLPWWLATLAIIAHRLHLKILGGCALSKLTKVSQGLSHDMDYLQQLSMRLFKKTLPKRRVKFVDRLIVTTSALVIVLAYLGLGWVAVVIASLAFAGYGGFSAYKMITQANNNSCELGGCDVVKQSRFSEVFGLKVELLGVIYFAILAAAQILLALNNFKPELLQSLVLALTSAGIVVSSVFIFLQAKVVQSFCASCMNIHGASLSVFVMQILRFAV